MLRTIQNVMEQTVSGVLKTGWKGPRSFHDGLMGRTHYNGGATSWRNKDGENIARSPMGKLAQRLKADTMQMATGRKYNPATMEAKDSTQGFLGRHVGNRIGGALHAVGDLTIGTTATALGWGTRAVGLGAAAAARPALRGAGHLAYQGARDATQMVVNNASLIHGMTKTRHGQNMLLGGGFLAAGGAALYGSSMDERNPHKNSQYDNEQIESLPGTLGAQGADRGSNAMVNTGADGDLVFAMHNMR